MLCVYVVLVSLGVGLSRDQAMIKEICMWMERREDRNMYFGEGEGRGSTTNIRVCNSKRPRGVT